jgi:hypothetical protein
MGTSVKGKLLPTAREMDPRKWWVPEEDCRLETIQCTQLVASGVVLSSIKVVSVR